MKTILLSKFDIINVHVYFVNNFNPNNRDKVFNTK